MGFKWLESKELWSIFLHVVPVKIPNNLKQAVAVVAVVVVAVADIYY